MNQKQKHLVGWSVSSQGLLLVRFGNPKWGDVLSTSNQVV